MELLIIVGIACGAIAAGLLSGSNRAGIGFLLGFLLGPIGVIVAAIMAANRTPAPVVITDERATKACPDCAELVLEAARKCRYCGAVLEPSPVGVLASPESVSSGAGLSRPIKILLLLFVITLVAIIVTQGASQ